MSIKSNQMLAHGGRSGSVEEKEEQEENKRGRCKVSQWPGTLCNTREHLLLRLQIGRKGRLGLGWGWGWWDGIPEAWF